MKRIYITDEAYNALVGYCLLKNKTMRGMAFEASSLLLEAISQKTNIPVDQPSKIPMDQKTSRPISQKTSGPMSQKDNIPMDQKTNVPVDQKASEPMVQKTETTSRKRQVKESIYDRWLVRFAGVIDGIQNMKAMEKEAKELKFLFYPVTRNKAVVVDRYWINKAIALGNHPKLKIGLSQAEEIAKSVIEGNKGDEELSLAERVGLALFMLNKDGYVIYSSSGWTLAIPDIALDVPGEKKPAPQEAKPEPKKAEEKEPEAKPEPKKGEPRAEDICSEKKIPEPADIDFMRIDGAVEQITIRECVEKRGYHFYMAMPEVGVVVNPQYESALLDKVKKGEVKFSREEVEKALESYLKNRAKSLTNEDKERILLRLLLQENKAIYVNGEWKVVDKPKTGKTESKPRVIIDGMQGQGV